MAQFRALLATDMDGTVIPLEEGPQREAEVAEFREAVGNAREVVVERGRLERLWPDVRVATEAGRAVFTTAGGLGYVPVSFSGLGSATGYELRVDGELVDQSVHGNDFWQTDYDPESQRWTRTYTIPLVGDRTHRIEFHPIPSP